MAVTLGKAATVSVSAAGSSYTAVGSIDSIELTKGYETADLAQMGDAAKRSTPSLQTFTGSFSGKRDRADAGQVIVMAAINTPALLYVKVLEDGTNGWSAQCALKPVKIGAKQGPDAETFAVEFEIASGAAPSAVP